MVLPDRRAAKPETEQNRHARPCAGHPRLYCWLKDVDGRDEPGHDEKRFKGIS
jgi:hypothetical protein